MPDLEGKVALITGGASGLGFALARRFAKAGAAVAIMDRSNDALARAARLEPSALLCAGDVASFADNVAAVDRTVQAYGRLDVFIGNAGIFDNWTSLESTTGEQLSTAFDEIFGINVKGYLLGVKAALEHLRASRGAVIFTASISGLYPGFGGVLYVPAKHAVVGLTRRLALELAPEIRVNAVAPGWMPTTLAGMTSLGQASRDPVVRRPSPERFPLEFVPELDDYVDLYVQLAGPGSKLMTGHVLVADSGQSLVPG